MPGQGRAVGEPRKTLDQISELAELGAKLLMNYPSEDERQLSILLSDVADKFERVIQESREHNTDKLRTYPAWLTSALEGP